MRLFVIEATGTACPVRGPGVRAPALGGSRLPLQRLLDLNLIAFVFPSPSAFATAIAPLTLAAALRAMGRCRWPFLVVAAGAPRLCSCTLSPALGWPSRWSAWGSVVRELASDGVRVVAAGARRLALSMLWPYYSVLDRARETGSFELPTAVYRDVVLRLFHALIGLWVVWRRFRADRRDPLGVLLVGGLAMYAYGFGRECTARDFARLIVLCSTSPPPTGRR